MSTITPPHTIQLTTEQLLQIDSFQKTLANLQAEIDKHSTNLQVVRNDNVALTKEKYYLEELVVKLQERKDTLEKENEGAKNILLEYQKNAEISRIQCEEYKKVQSTAQTDLEAQRASLEVLKAEIQTDREELNKNMTMFADDSALLEKKKNILTEAINQL